MSKTVGCGAAATELARLLGTVARVPTSHSTEAAVTKGYVLDDPQGRWHIEVAPDGSTDVTTPDGAAVLRGRLAAPRVVAGIVAIPYRDCIHCRFPTRERNHTDQPAHAECEQDALPAERIDDAPRQSRTAALNRCAAAIGAAAIAALFFAPAAAAQPAAPTGAGVTGSPTATRVTGLVRGGEPADCDVVPLPDCPTDSPPPPEPTIVPPPLPSSPPLPSRPPATTPQPPRTPPTAPPRTTPPRTTPPRPKPSNVVTRPGGGGGGGNGHSVPRYHTREASGPQLPATGRHPAAVTAAGAAMVVAGGALLVVTRRRRSPSADDGTDT